MNDIQFDDTNSEVVITGGARFDGGVVKLSSSVKVEGDKLSAMSGTPSIALKQASNKVEVNGSLVVSNNISQLNNQLVATGNELQLVSFPGNSPRLSLAKRSSGENTVVVQGDEFVSYDCDIVVSQPLTEIENITRARLGKDGTAYAENINIKDRVKSSRLTVSKTGPDGYSFDVNSGGLTNIGETSLTGDVDICGDTSFDGDLIVEPGHKIYLESTTSDIMLKRSNGTYVSLRSILSQLGVTL